MNSWFHNQDGNNLQKEVNSHLICCCYYLQSYPRHWILHFCCVYGVDYYLDDSCCCIYLLIDLKGFLDIYPFVVMLWCYFWSIQPNFMLLTCGDGTTCYFQNFCEIFCSGCEFSITGYVSRMMVCISLVLTMASMSMVLVVGWRIYFF